MKDTLTNKIKKAKKGDTVIWDERADTRDNFKLSLGNLNVLETIPKMMMETSWRRKLRELVLDYHGSKIVKSAKKYFNINKQNIQRCLKQK